jgi:hypothetical protein
MLAPTIFLSWNSILINFPKIVNFKASVFFTEAGRVVIFHGLGVSEGFQNRIGGQNSGSEI